MSYLTVGPQKESGPDGFRNYDFRVTASFVALSGPSLALSAPISCVLDGRDTGKHDGASYVSVRPENGIWPPRGPKKWTGI